MTDLEQFKQFHKDRIKAAKRFRVNNTSLDERKVAIMSTTIYDGWEETAKPKVKDPVYTTNIKRKLFTGKQKWIYDIDDMEVELKHIRRELAWIALQEERMPLNKAYEYLELEQTREGLTLGWEFNAYMDPSDLFTWIFSADHEVEIFFHNLKDVSNLYKTEEELA